MAKIKLIGLVVLLFLTTSCARKVCGGSGGKRCVESSVNTSTQRIS